MGSTATTALIPLVLLLASVLWVYQDASAHDDRGASVRFSAGSVEVSGPAVWAVGCLCLWVVFMPLYLVCRRQAG
ncbi:hypothetical protein [Kitasatospora sp. NPDC094015]|uniref:hypothetical protein n=1 Tax=Kitasatospora sp. NPDC094015 TaxID=3155205 RepID=UPI00331CC582